MQVSSSGIDPARNASEGIRRIEEREAVAEYEVGPLPDGRWAVRYSLDLGLTGVCCPWTAYPSREECLDAFLTRAREWFASQYVTDRQERTQSSMLQVLTSGLFGFIEPNIDEDATRRHAEVMQIVKNRVR